MRDPQGMRTTLDLDADVLRAARKLAIRRGTTIGKVFSELARKALQSSPASRVRNGVPLLPGRGSGGPRKTMKLVNELRDGRGADVAGILQHLRKQRPVSISEMNQPRRRRAQRHHDTRRAGKR